MPHSIGANTSATMLIANRPTAGRKVAPTEDFIYAGFHKSDPTTTYLPIPTFKELSIFPIHVLLRCVLGLFGSVLLLSMVSQYLDISQVSSTSNATYAQHPATSSATAIPTTLPHKEIQAILARAKQVRSELDGQLRGLRREVWYAPPSAADVENVRRQMAMYVERAEAAVRQQADGMRQKQSVWGASELTAIGHAERHALFEVRKVVVIMDEIEVVLQQRLLRLRQRPRQQ